MLSLKLFLGVTLIWNQSFPGTTVTEELEWFLTRSYQSRTRHPDSVTTVSRQPRSTCYMRWLFHIALHVITKKHTVVVSFHKNMASTIHSGGLRILNSYPSLSEWMMLSKMKLIFQKPVRSSQETSPLVRGDCWRCLRELSLSEICGSHGSNYVPPETSANIHQATWRRTSY